MPITNSAIREAINRRFSEEDVVAVDRAIDKLNLVIKREPQFALLEDLLRIRTRARDAIEGKHASLGGAPGQRVADLNYSTPGGLGFVQVFERGAIYWRNDLGALWVYGAIYQKYVALGGASSFLGHPTTDETGTSDGVGRFNHFEAGSVYWHPSIGAFETHGAIRARWQVLGSELFGYPITDETPTELDTGRFNHFRRFLPDGTHFDASIYWSAKTDAHAVYGHIKDRWIELGEQYSYFGFPLTDETDWTDPDTQKTGRISHFERGAIAWTAEDNKVVEFPERRVFKTGHIGVSSVGGWAELTITSAGTFHFKGHLHNSGFVDLYCTMGAALKVPGTNEAIVTTYEANVGGTTSIDVRDEDWNESGYKNEIRAYWDRLRELNTLTSTIQAQLGTEAVIELILLPLVGAILAISLISGGTGPDTHCETTEGFHTVGDLNNRTTIEPDGVRCTRSR